MSDEVKEGYCDIQTKGWMELAIQRIFELMRSDRAFKVGVLVLVFLFGFLFVIIINAEKVVKIIDSLNKCDYQLSAIEIEKK